MKKYLIIGGLTLLGYGVYRGHKKYREYEGALKKLKIKVSNIRKGGISGGALKADVFLNVINQSNIDLTANTFGFVKVTKLLFYTYSGKYIGEAQVNIDNLELPSNTTTPIEEPIPINVPFNLSSVLGVGLDLLNDSKNIIVKAELEVLGKKYILE